MPDTLRRDREAVMLWRKAERQRIIAERLKLSVEERRRHAAAIARHLTNAVGNVHGLTIGVYWPFRGEPNLRSWMEQIHACGEQCALPVVRATRPARVPYVAARGRDAQRILEHFIVTEHGCSPGPQRRALGPIH